MSFLSRKKVTRFIVFLMIQFVLICFLGWIVSSVVMDNAKNIPMIYPFTAYLVLPALTVLIYSLTEKNALKPVLAFTGLSVLLMPLAMHINLLLPYHHHYNAYLSQSIGIILALFELLLITPFAIIRGKKERLKNYAPARRTFFFTAISIVLCFIISQILDWWIVRKYTISDDVPYRIGIVFVPVMSVIVAALIILFLILCKKQCSNPYIGYMLLITFLLLNTSELWQGHIYITNIMSFGIANAGLIICLPAILGVEQNLTSLNSKL